MTLNMQKGKKGRGIEWTDATWNPVAGCLHGCRWEMPSGKVAVCYAETVAERVATHAYEDGFAHHYWHPQRLNAPKRKQTPLKIFTGSMADLFGHWVPDEQIEQVLQVMRETPQHTYQILTKNPVRTRQFDMPGNAWVGASMPPDYMWGKRLTDSQQRRMMSRTLSALADANATVRWVSFEPLSWDVTPILRESEMALDWAVIGAASDGPKLYPPQREDFAALLDLLQEQGTAVFFKGNLKSLPDAAADWREEFPEVNDVV